MDHRGVNEQALAQFYLDFKQNFYQCCKLNGINNAMFVAKDKLVRVRFGEESHLIETNEQLIVFYDPKRHVSFKSCYDKGQLVSKLVLVIFANGEDIREQAVNLHQRTTQMLHDLSEATEQAPSLFKIRDHQHITYDLFAADKGLKKTTTHGLRFVPDRYRQQSLLLPADTKHTGYVVAQLAMPMHLVEAAETKLSADEPYQPLYKAISRTLMDIAEYNEVKKLALIANGRHPIVRFQDEDKMQIDNELVHISFSDNEEQSFLSDWENTNLVDMITLVFVPVNSDTPQNSYGRYLNKIQQILREMAREMGLDPQRDDLMLRFHQNTLYKMR